MDIAAIAGSQSSALSQQGVVETGKNNLGMDDFFKLLTTQLVSQDPLQPMQDTEFISQMASFSSLSQMELIAQNTEASRAQQEKTAVMSLIGKQINADDVNGESISGVVTRVELVDDSYLPFIGDTQIPFTSITRISDIAKAPAASATPAEPAENTLG